MASNLKLRLDAGPKCKFLISEPPCIIVPACKCSAYQNFRLKQSDSRFAKQALSQANLHTALFHEAPSKATSHKSLHSSATAPALRAGNRGRKSSRKQAKGTCTAHAGASTPRASSHCGLRLAKPLDSAEHACCLHGCLSSCARASAHGFATSSNACTQLPS